MKKSLIVLDTNVLISAIVFGGKPREIFKLIIERKVLLATSDYILGELETVLQRSKFSFPKETVRTILNEIISLSDIVYPKNKISIITRDPDDNNILECAITAKANVIISGDNDLLDLKVFKTIPILTPRDFLELL